MEYTIQEIDGRLFKVFPHGGRLLHVVKGSTKLPRKSGVYLITQISTGMKYVGSSMNLKQRLNAYQKDNVFSRSSALTNIPCKDLRIEILTDCVEMVKEDILKLELEWILKLGTVSPNGFNLKCPVTQKKLTKEKIFLSTGRRSDVGQNMFPRGYTII